MPLVFFGSMKKYKLSAEKRTVLGRKVKKIRKEGSLPANIYGKKVKSQAVVVKEKEFAKVFKEAGETSIIELMLGKVKKPVLIHNVQTDPVSDMPLHVDFHQVDLKEKVMANVPVEVLGEAPAEKQGLGTMVQYIDEIDVEALPAELPEKFEVDISGLEEVNAAIFVKDLKYDKKKIEIKLDDEEVVVKIEPLRKEEEVAPPAEEEVVGEEEEKEGEEVEEEVKKEELHPADASQGKEEETPKAPEVPKK